MKALQIYVFPHIDSVIPFISTFGLLLGIKRKIFLIACTFVISFYIELIFVSISAHKENPTGEYVSITTN